MAQPASKIEQVKQRRAIAANLRSATSSWREKYGDHKHYDKQGFGFTHRSDNRAGLNAFLVKEMAFEAYTGTYGNSSVGRSWSVDQETIDRLIHRALNTHKQAIFDTMADILDKEADEMLGEARAELAELQQLLNGADRVERQLAEQVTS